MGKDDSKKESKTEQRPTSEATSEKTDESVATAAAPEPTPKQEKSQRQIDPIEDFFEYVQSDEKAQQFMMMYVLAKKASGPDDFKDELKKRDFLAHFEQWKKSGEPGVNLPNLPKASIKFPTALYRLQDRMKDKIYVYFSDGTEEGIKYIPKYEEIENPETGMMEESKIKIGQTEEYTMEFTPKLAQRLIDDYNKLAPVGTNALGLHYWIGDRKLEISEENFVNLSHKQIVEIYNNKKALN